MCLAPLSARPASGILGIAGYDQDDFCSVLPHVFGFYVFLKLLAAEALCFFLLPTLGLSFIYRCGGFDRTWYLKFTPPFLAAFIVLERLLVILTATGRIMLPMTLLRSGRNDSGAGVNTQLLRVANESTRGPAPSIRGRRALAMV